MRRFRIVEGFMRVLAAAALGAAATAHAAAPMQQYLVLERTDMVQTGAGGIAAVAAQQGGGGTLTLTGVSGTVTHALLYWNGLDLEWPALGFTGGDADYDQPGIRFDGQDVLGTRVAGFGSNDCWPQPEGPDSAALYRADVTALVQARGDGSYVFSGLADKPGHSANGISLIVYFDDGNPGNDRRITHYEGMQSNRSGLVFDAPLTYRGGSVDAIVHVSDGQSDLLDGSVYWYAKPDVGIERSLRYRSPLHDGLLLWGGQSVPTMGHGRGANGQGLWDIRRFALTPLYGALGHYSNRISYAGGDDCITWHVVQVVEQADIGAPALSPHPFDFGDVVVGTHSAPQRFTLANPMPGDIDIGAVVGNALFAVVADTCSNTVLAAGGSCTVDVVFRPGAVSLPIVSELRIEFTDTALSATGPAFRTELRGAGVPDGAFSRVEPQPRACRFPDTRVGETSAPIALRFANTGTLPIDIAEASLFQHPAQTWFTIQREDCAGRTLPPGSSCSADVALRPPRTGLANDALRLTYSADDAAAQIVAITLTGPGVAAAGARAAGGSVTRGQDGVFSDSFEGSVLAVCAQ